MYFYHLREAFNSSPNTMLQCQQTSGKATDAYGINFMSAFTKLNPYAGTINFYTSGNDVQFNKITIPTASNPHVTLVSNKSITVTSPVRP